MQALHLLGIVLLTCILVFGVLILRKEGFGPTEDKLHQDFVSSSGDKFNQLNVALIASNSEPILDGGKGRSIYNIPSDNLSEPYGPGGESKYIYTTNIRSAPAASNRRGEGFTGNGELEAPYTTQGEKTGLFARIEKCEKVNSVNCDAFDKPDFSETCGICLDIGTNSENKAAIGGLLLTKADRELAQATRKGNFLPKYEPTIGTCPTGMFVSNKKECQRLTNQLACAKNKTVNSPDGCSQCYYDSSYSIVNPNDPNYVNDNLIAGYGTLYVYGEGNLIYDQSILPNNNSATGGTKLSSTEPVIIVLQGPEFKNNLKLSIRAEKKALPYDDTIRYYIGDKVIDNGEIFIMKVESGVPGYSPSNRPDMWTKSGQSIRDYRPPSSAYVMGYLTGRTQAGVFNMDLYQLVLSDSVNDGRKPRNAGIANINGIDVIKMAPGYNKLDMKLTVNNVFTFVDPTSQEAALCPSSPFITNASSINFLGNDPCYTKGSAPGNYSLECLQSVFITNGCLNRGKGYPSDNAKASTILFDGHNVPQTISEIANRIYSLAVISASGNDVNGNKITMADWSAASEFCTGNTISSPCETDTRDTGPLTVDCLTYLWDNRGENSPEGPTYVTSERSRSFFSSGKANRFCTKEGTLSPKNVAGGDNTMAIGFWQKQGGVTTVKALMKTIHLNANSMNLSESVKTPLILQCYGRSIDDNRGPPIRTNWLSDTNIDNVTQPGCIDASYPGGPNCKSFTKINLNDNYPACGTRVTVFAEANYQKYLFSIPVGKYTSRSLISEIPGNTSGASITGNVTLLFPSNCLLKLTINNGLNFSGPITYIFIKSSPIQLRWGAGDQITWDPKWTEAQSIQLEYITDLSKLGIKPKKAPLVWLRPTSFPKEFIFKGSAQAPWRDESGNGKHAYLYSGAFGLNGEGNGIILDASKKTAWTFPNVNLGCQWTIGLWFKMTGPSNGNLPAILSKKERGFYGGPSICGPADNKRVYPVVADLYDNVSQTFYGPQYTMPTGEWTQIFVILDAGNCGVDQYRTFTLYINGEKYNSARNNGRQVQANQNSDFTIGSNGLGYNFGWVNGEIGEVIMYDYMLSDLEIYSEYQLSKPIYFPSSSASTVLPLPPKPKPIGVGWSI